MGRSKKGVILVPSQYLNLYSLHEPASPMKPFFNTDGRDQKAYKDKDNDSTKIKFSEKDDTGNHKLLIYGGFENGIDVDNWKEGSQIIQKEGDLEQFVNLVKKHIPKYGNRFHYTLLTGKDVEELGGEPPKSEGVE